MIYCIWYPAGGFGHFVNAIISLYGKNFAKVDNVGLKFSSTGDSHQYVMAAPKYYHDPVDYDFDFVKNKNYTVLIDNGIQNQSERFTYFFPGATVIKICYSDESWPIIARTLIDKAMKSSIDLELGLDLNRWDRSDAWAYREKYFLYLKDHSLRHTWKSQDNYKILNVDDLLDYHQFYYKLQTLFEIESFEADWYAWRDANKQYIDPVVIADKVIKSIRCQQSLTLDNITDIWTQAVIYYYIWLEYNFEVPHNDYSEWFTNTTDIVTMLKKYKII